MTCQWERCWRESSVLVRLDHDTLEYCSAHALGGLGTWPVREYQTYEASRPGAAMGAASEPFPSSRGEGPGSPPVSNAESFAAMLQVRGWTLTDIKRELTDNLEELR